MDVYVIKRHVRDSWNPPPPTFLAVAATDLAARTWIWDETEGKHNSGHLYAPGHPPQWWLDQGIFTIEPLEVHTNER